MPKDTIDTKGTKDTEQFATIQPAELKLGGNGVQGKSPTGITDKSNLLPFVFGTFVFLMGVWVFIFLPDSVSTPDISDTTTNTTSQNPISETQKTGEAVSAGSDSDLAPFEMLDAARARKKTEATLAEFVQLQIQLEDSMQVKQWAADEYSNIIAIANQGDVLFLEAQYKESMLKYKEGSTALKALLASGEAQYSDAMNLAKEALTKLEPELAMQSYSLAKIIHPDNQNVIDGLLRANNMPRVLAFLKDAEKLIKNAEFEKARDLFKNAQALDPQMPGIKASLGKLQLSIRERNFRRHLSEAYAALNSAKYQKAEQSFNNAARIKPDHASISDGLRQLKSARLLVAIAEIEAKADSQIQAEQWTTLPDTYATALELDPNLKFAREGIRMAKKRAQIDTILSQIITNPGKLSSDTSYRDALSAFNSAMELKTQGPRLVTQLGDVKKILDNAAIPVTFQIISDNVTEVGIVRRGSLGVFKTKTLELRPGSYIFTGSRPGCRDLRREVQVTPGMNSVAVQCEESI